jgi:hypothetical protein
MSEVNLDPIAWWWNPDVDAATLGQMLTNNKGRLISLDVFFSGGQQRLAAVWVSNTGAQNLPWWWNPNVDAATLGQMLANNQGRLVVLEPFAVGGVVRFAAVWVSNVGTGGQSWWWNPDVDPATLGQMLANNQGRLTTLRTYMLGTTRHYAAVWVLNTGANAHAWWWNPDVDGATLGEMLRSNNGRLISLDSFMSGTQLRYAAAWIENAGASAKTWFWYHGVDAAWLGKKFDQFCSYPIELRRYDVGFTPQLACVMDAYNPPPDPEGAKLVQVSGSGSLDTLTNNIAPMDESLSTSLTLTNPTSSSVKVTEGRLLLTQKGGWVETYFKVPLFGSTGIFNDKSPDIPAGQSYSASPSFGWGMGATDFIVRIKVESGTSKQHAHSVIPTLRSGYSAPPKFSAPKPVFIGLWTNPSEIVPIWLGSQQTRWLSVGGNIFNGSGTTVRLVGFHLTFEVDGKIIVGSDLAMNFNHYVGNDFVPLPPPQGGEMSLTEELAYFVCGFDVGKMPAWFSKATVRVIANYKIGTRCGATVCETPAVALGAISLAPPIKGRWHWGNSPNHTAFDAHAWPHQRFSVDLTMVDDTNSTIKPDADPNVNDSFYAYKQPVLAMKAGKVIKSWDQEDENFGKTANPAIKNINYVLIEHAPNEISGYYHLRKGQNVVKVGDNVVVGQQLGQVGNSGGSSEPHLHIGYVNLDETGRGTLRPMQFTGLRTVNDVTAAGVPATDVYLSGDVTATRQLIISDRMQLVQAPAVRCTVPSNW